MASLQNKSHLFHFACFRLIQKREKRRQGKKKKLKEEFKKADVNDY